jgi:hypothetical protein
MRRNGLMVWLCGAALLAMAGSTGIASAQVNCEAIPAGPSRTDCYIGLSRINRDKSRIAAGVARQQSDAAIYRSVTGKRPGTKVRRAAPARSAYEDWTISWPR